MSWLGDLKQRGAVTCESDDCTEENKHSKTSLSCLAFVFVTSNYITKLLWMYVMLIEAWLIMFHSLFLLSKKESNQKSKRSIFLISVHREKACFCLQRPTIWQINATSVSFRDTHCYLVLGASHLCAMLIGLCDLLVGAFPCLTGRSCHLADVLAYGWEEGHRGFAWMLKRIFLHSCVLTRCLSFCFVFYKNKLSILAHCWVATWALDGGECDTLMTTCKLGWCCGWERGPWV